MSSQSGAARRSESVRIDLAELEPALYQELKKIAVGYLKRRPASHTLQPTVLVNEAFLKLAANPQLKWQSRTHFFATAAQMMRRIIVDYYRNKRRLKRGGGAIHVAFDEGLHQAEDQGVDVLALDAALTKLSEMDERRATVVELRFFGGLGVEEVAEAMETSPATVKRDWSLAKAWLFRELSKSQKE